MFDRLPRDIEKVLLASLAEHPDEWVFSDDCVPRHTQRDGTPFEAINARLGAELWLANSYYGFRVRFFEKTWGSVSDFSVFFGSWGGWRRRLYDAAMREWRVRRAPAADAEASIRRRLGIAT